MAERDISELVVRMKGEGTDETADALDETGDTFEETAEQSEDSAETISENADIWDRAMNVVVTGLLVASAGLLSIVPVIGEVFEGLFAVVEALAFQIDSILRPHLNGLTESFFNLAAAIFEADSAFDIVMAFFNNWKATLAIIIGVLAAFLLIAFKVFGVMATLAAIKGVVIGAAGLLATAIGALLSPFGLLVLAILAVIAIIAILITDYRGLRTALVLETVKLVTRIISLYMDLKRKVLGTLGRLVSGAISKFVDIKNGAKRVIGNLIDDARTWGKRVILAFIAGIKRVASSIGSVVETQVTDRVEGTVVGKLLSGASDTINLDPRDRVSAPDRGDTIFNIDGRDVTDALGRFRKDGPLSRGR